MSEVFNVSSIFGGKSPLKSMTAWGLAIYVAGSAFIGEVCGVGLVDAALCVTLQGAADTIGVVLTALGLRRAAA